MRQAAAADFKANKGARKSGFGAEALAYAAEGPISATERT